MPDPEDTAGNKVDQSSYAQGRYTTNKQAKYVLYRMVIEGICEWRNMSLVLSLIVTKMTCRAALF